MRANDGRVVPNFINQALKNEDITVYGNGSQTRSFCYVSDLVRGIYKLMMSNFYEPVNIGNPSEMSILEFAETVIKITNSNSRIIYKDLPVDDPKVRRPDISRAKELLDWEPEVDLREGLEKTVEYFRY
jgi:dTDP-glucose 4,6-dehydratase